MNKVQGIIYAISSAVAFGLIPAFAVLAYSGGINAISTAFFRFFIATLILYGIIRSRRISLAIDKKTFGRLLFLSIAGYAATCITLFLSYVYIPISLAITMHFTYPALVTLLSFFILKEKMGTVKIISLLLSVAGVYILSDPGNAAINIKGVILALASGVFYSIYTVELAREEIKKMNGLALTFYVSLFSAASIFIYAGATESLVFTAKASVILPLLGIAIICTVFAILAYYKAVQTIGPSDTAILSTFEPVTGVLLGILAFGEKLSLSSALGSALVIMSVLLFSINKNNKSEMRKITEASEN